jgi:hypothetical protein
MAGCGLMVGGVRVTGLATQCVPGTRGGRAVWVVLTPKRRGWVPSRHLAVSEADEAANAT